MQIHVYWLIVVDLLFKSIAEDMRVQTTRHMLLEVSFVHQDIP